MRAHLAACSVVALLGAAACSDDGGERILAGPGTDPAPSDTGPAPGPGPAPGDPELALLRCSDIPRLTAEPTVAEPSDDPEVAAWQQQRAQFGLPSDEAATRAAAEDPDHHVEMGFPMTPSEEAAFSAAEAVASTTAGEVGRRFATEASYGGHWIDSADRSVVALAVAGDPADWQARADAEIGPGRVRVIQVDHTEAELRAAQDAALDAARALDLRGVGGGTFSMQNVAYVSVEVLDPEVVAHIAAAVPPGTTCVEGAEPSDVVPEGPQLQEGDGWRLLADEPGIGAPYATGFAADATALAGLWADVGLPGDPPEVDFATEVVAWFGPAVSGSCPEIRLDDVVLDTDADGAPVLRPEIVLIGGQRICTSDANPHAYVVAVARDRLPDRFTVSAIRSELQCCPEGTTEVDLTSP